MRLTPLETKPVYDFLARLIPNLDDCLSLDNNHKVDITPLDNGNVQFSLSARITSPQDSYGYWALMSTVEAEVGRGFWVRVVEIARCFYGVRFSLPDNLVAGAIVACLPGAGRLAQEREAEPEPELARRKEAPVVSRGRTRTRVPQVKPVEVGDEDVVDALGDVAAPDGPGGGWFGPEGAD
jgi:hypothetical protein